MRVSSIQHSVARTVAQPQARVARTQTLANNPESKQVTNPMFKGNGNGAIAGLGFGLVAGLTVVCGAMIAGVITLPAIIGSAAVLGSGAAGAYAGNKIEDKINEMKNK